LFWYGKDNTGIQQYYPSDLMTIKFSFRSVYTNAFEPFISRTFKQSNDGKCKELAKTAAGLTDPIKEFTIFNNYPNPFNSTTQIKYNIPQSGKVKLIIYNILGQKVKTLVDAIQNTGKYSVIWDGRNEYGNEVGSGVYFYTVVYKSEKVSERTKKILLLK
jgi:hypothetical protein